MNAGLTISFIIGGLLMLSVAGMNLRVAGSSQELALTTITREHAAHVVEMLNDDFPNMGYDVTAPTDPILTIADKEKIQFYRNVYDDSTRSAELITWELTDESPGTGNPEHRILRRIEKEAATGQEKVTVIASGVTRFTLHYLDTHGKDLLEEGMVMPTPVAAGDLDKIKQIHLELEMQSAAPVSGSPAMEGRYIRTIYEKRYTPQNLDLK